MAFEQPQRPGGGPLHEFWGELLVALFKAEPNVDGIAANRTLERADFDPENEHHLLSVDLLVNITNEELKSLKTQHAKFTHSLTELVPVLPYEANTSGIVMTADSDSIGLVITTLLMLRRAESKLPVQVFLTSADEHALRSCNASLTALEAVCYDMDEFLRLPDSFPRSYLRSHLTTDPTGSGAPPALNVTTYQFKPFALLFSTFQNILFLDADAFPIHKPDRLMEADPFRSHGLVTWPDFWLPTVSPLFWEVAAAPPPEPPTIKSRATESGIMMVDKSQHGDTLLLAAYYNLYGPQAYYRLHSQTAWGEGDKETYRLAAQALQRPVWHVTEPARFLSVDEVHDGSGIMQMDPEEDWMRAQQKQPAKKEEQPLESSAAPRDGDGEAKSPRWLFAHLNRVKIDARRLNESVGHIIFKKVDGQYSRLWGPESVTLIDQAGYDVERIIWDLLLEADCRQSFLEECELLSDFVSSVFPP